MPGRERARVGHLEADHRPHVAGDRIDDRRARQRLAGDRVDHGDAVRRRRRRARAACGSPACRRGCGRSGAASCPRARSTRRACRRARRSTKLLEYDHAPSADCGSARPGSPSRLRNRANGSIVDDAERARDRNDPRRRHVREDVADVVGRTGDRSRARRSPPHRPPLPERARAARAPPARASRRSRSRRRACAAGRRRRANGLKGRVRPKRGTKRPVRAT